MLVKEFNEYMQFGFPKDYFFEGSDAWYERYEQHVCDATGKLLLPDEEELDPNVVYGCWIGHPAIDNVDEGIDLEEAVQDYQQLKLNPPFKVGDDIVVVSEVGFLPDYWPDHERYTAYHTNYKIASIKDNLIKVAYLYEGTWTNSLTTAYSLTGYKVKVVKDKQESIRRRKVLGFEQDYTEYLVPATEEVLAKAGELKEIYPEFSKLWMLTSDLCTGVSFNPSKRAQVLEALKIIEPLVNKAGKALIDIK